MARMRPREATLAASSEIPCSLRDLVEAVVERVVARVQRKLPGLEQIRELESRVRRLGRRVESGGFRVGASRAGRPPLYRECTIEGCGLPHTARGFCSKHYQVWRRLKLRSHESREVIDDAERLSVGMR